MSTGERLGMSAGGCEPGMVPGTRFAFGSRLGSPAFQPERDVVERPFESKRAGERRALHRAVAEAMERLYQDKREAHSGELSEHFYAAERWDMALTYAQRAGEQAQALGAPRAAIAQYTWTFNTPPFFKVEGGERIDSIAFSELRRPATSVKTGVIVIGHGQYLEVICARQTNVTACPLKPTLSRRPGAASKEVEEKMVRS